MLLPDTSMHGHHPEALRIAALGLSLLVIMLGHWLTPVEPMGMHVVHVLLRRLLLIPVIAAAVWFGLRGSLIVAGVCTIIFADAERQNPLHGSAIDPETRSAIMQGIPGTRH